MLEKVKTFYSANRKKTNLAAAGLAFLLISGTGVYFVTRPTETSASKPYSVRINSYRTAKDAKHTIKRLARAGIKAYALERMEKNNDIWIDVHAGAYKNKSEAEAFQKELKAKGLTDAKLIEYKQIAKSVKAFDDAPSSEKREYKLPSAEIPQMADRMLSNLKHFPIDDNYKVVALKIADSNTAPKSAFWNYFDFNYTYVPKGNKVTAMMADTDSVSQAIYEDKVYGWRAGVIVLACKNANATATAIINRGASQFGQVVSEKLAIKTDQGSLVGNLYSTNDAKSPTLTFVGEFAQTGHVLTLVTKDLTKDLFMELLNSDNDGKGLLIFPEVRFNLSIMPRGESGAVFTHFELKRVDWAYARERGNAWWANNMVNYWNATGYFMQDAKPFAIGFFNLNYDSTARKIHENFMYEKRKIVNNEFMRAMMNDMGIYSASAKVREGADGWYLGRADGNELSFTKGSVVVALNAYRRTMGQDDLKKIANTLQIW